MSGKKGRSGGARPGSGRKPLVGCDWRTRKYPRKKLSGCAVYVIHEIDAPDVCKIGISIDPSSRFSSIQTGTWRELVMPFFVRVGSQEEALRVESYVHGKLSSKKCRGEWFYVSPSEAVDAVNSGLMLVENSKQQSPEQSLFGEL